MRFRRLDLERYGPFTGRALDFSRPAKLYLVYGPNEAGKSSALAAITDLLFGFEHRARNDFLHDARELRVGARLSAADGAEIAFRRRRGNKNTLIDADEQPLPDDALLPFLGGLSRDVFTRAFGLSTESLRSGAEEMLNSEGDVGATLFAAASGLKGLNDLRRGLEQEADGIFAPRASKDRRFYQALQRREEARRAMRDSELKAGDWTKLNERIAELSSRLDEVSGQRRRAVEACARLARLKRVAPCLRLVDETTAELQTLRGLPETAPGFAADLAARLERAREAKDAEERAGQALQRAREAHAAISVDEAILAHAAEITDLTQRSGACANSRRDLPRVQAEADQKGRELDRLAARLGLPDGDALAAAQPTDAAIAKVARLIEEGRALDEAGRSRAAALNEARDDLAGLARQREAQGSMADPRPLRERLAALMPELRRLERLPDLVKAREGQARSLAEETARLLPAVDLDLVARAALPDAAAIGRFRQRFEETEREAARLNERHDEIRETIARLERDQRELSSGRPVPSAEAIAEAREARDAGWRTLRGRLLGRAHAMEDADLPAAVAGFERARDEADRLADEAARDAERVARHAVTVAELAKAGEAATELSRRIDALRDDHAARLAEWKDLWRPVTDAPRPPSEMEAWSRQVAGLLERRTALAATGDEIRSLESAEQRLLPLVGALARESGLTGLDAGGALVLAHGVEQRLHAIGDAWEQAREIETRRRDTEARIARLETLAADGATAFAEWAARWRDSVPAIGLAADATLEDAESALAIWRDVPGMGEERAYRQRRIAGMQRDLESFEGALRRLAGALAPESADASPEHLLQLLCERLDEAKERRTRKAEAADRLAEAELSCERAREARRHAAGALAEAEAIFPDGADLAFELRRLQRREELRARLSELHQRLLEQGDGIAEATLREDLATFDPDAAEARMSELRTEEERLDVEAREIHSERDRELHRRQDLETGTGAELASFDKEGAEAELASAARDWMVLKLGALLISGAVERHRAGQQDPLMARAGALFATVTGGRFEGLAQDYDETDTPRLVGRRHGGAIVHLGGMSEGTRDQLYLALRLAYLEDYAGRAEPVPFIGDDLFSTFDDERTENGLKVLAAIGDRVQPILFTHHRRLVELARETLGGEAAILDLP